MEYSIKDMAEHMGVTAHTLRYYEKEGIIPFVDRDDQGNRVYKDHTIDWLGFIKCLRETGMSIKDLKHFATLSMSGDHTIPERKEILYAHRKIMEKQLEDTITYLKKINWKIEYYESLSSDELPTPLEHEKEALSS